MVNLAQIPAKSVVMEIVVADIPARFGMLLSRSWGTKIEGSIKLDLTYATIPVFGGQERRLYRERRFVKMVTKADNSVNSPVYTKEGEFSCLMLEEDQDYLQEPSFCQVKTEQSSSNEEGGIWTLHFDGANSKEGNGAGILLISPIGQLIPLSFKFEYEATNNVAEYEALLLGLQTAKNMNIQSLKVLGDSELEVRQVRNQCQAKNP